MEVEKAMKHLIEAELNRLYKNNWDEYDKKLDYYKGMGYKILRNFQGDHRVEYSPNLNELFGGIFGNIFQNK